MALALYNLEESNLNIQIFGTKKCNETKKAERFFKERGIKYQFVDMKDKGMSKGEFNSVAQVMVDWKIWLTGRGKIRICLHSLNILQTKINLERYLIIPR